ncbi:MAG TPA: hypothetical protein VN048_19815 [Verrucomicrobiae bacterium]|nr:hypothetical protein [Verrucomicrobiae bacterium]
MKIETSGSILAARLAEALKTSALMRLLFPRVRLAPVPIARRSLDLRRRPRSRF